MTIETVHTINYLRKRYVGVWGHGILCFVLFFGTLQDFVMWLDLFFGWIRRWIRVPLDTWGCNWSTHLVGFCARKISTSYFKYGAFARSDGWAKSREGRERNLDGLAFVLRVERCGFNDQWINTRRRNGERVGVGEAGKILAPIFGVNLSLFNFQAMTSRPIIWFLGQFSWPVGKLWAKLAGKDLRTRTPNHQAGFIVDLSPFQQTLPLPPANHQLAQKVPKQATK